MKFDIEREGEGGVVDAPADTAYRSVPKLRTDLAKEICRTFGLNPDFFFDLVSKFGPDQKKEALKYLEERKTSEALIERCLQAFRVYWDKYGRKDYSKLRSL